MNVYNGLVENVSRSGGRISWIAWGDGMIAEIRNKGSIDTSISEDELTGNLFGNLRYLPFDKGLQCILKNSIQPRLLDTLFDHIDSAEWSGNIDFWRRYDEGEPDVVLTFPNMLILVEVKYNSPLSSPDQLTKYCRLLDRVAGNKKKAIILLAREEDARNIYGENVTDAKRSRLNGIPFGYMTWQSVYDAIVGLVESGNLNQYEAVVLSDLINLLYNKGFEGFRQMTVSDLAIDRENLWAFDDSDTVEGDFSFIFKKSIERGLCYEFG